MRGNHRELTSHAVSLLELPAYSAPGRRASTRVIPNLSWAQRKKGGPILRKGRPHLTNHYETRASALPRATRPLQFYEYCKTFDAAKP